MAVTLSWLVLIVLIPLAAAVYKTTGMVLRRALWRPIA